KCNTVTRDDIPFPIWSGRRPDQMANGISSRVTVLHLPSGQGFAPTPRISADVLNVVSSSLPLPRPLAH
ncbi:hypothetical protein PSY17_23120, partial [Shigella flexneri]|nr:hypothetical protein [Shigella flexneri]